MKCVCYVTVVECLSVFFFFSSRRRHTRYWRDWSSDVCSSDLGRGRRWPWQALLELDAAGERAVHDEVGPGGEAGDREIGRASCRERVEISVVAVSLKKKIKHAMMQ